MTSLQRYSFVKCETLKDPNGRWVLFEDLQKQRQAEMSGRRLDDGKQFVLFIVAAALFVGFGAFGVYQWASSAGWW